MYQFTNLYAVEILLKIINSDAHLKLIKNLQLIDFTFSTGPFFSLKYIQDQAERSKLCII